MVIWRYTEDNMTKEVRFLMDDELYKRYRIICVKNDLSMPRQSAELIKHFVEVQEINIELMKCLNKQEK